LKKERGDQSRTEAGSRMKVDLAVASVLVKGIPEGENTNSAVRGKLFRQERIYTKKKIRNHLAGTGLEGLGKLYGKESYYFPRYEKKAIPTDPP